MTATVVEPYCPCTTSSYTGQCVGVHAESRAWLIVDKKDKECRGTIKQKARNKGTFCWWIPLSGQSSVDTSLDLEAKGVAFTISPILIESKPSRREESGSAVLLLLHDTLRSLRRLATRTSLWLNRSEGRRHKPIFRREFIHFLDPTIGTLSVHRIRRVARLHLLFDVVLPLITKSTSLMELSEQENVLSVIGMQSRVFLCLLAPMLDQCPSRVWLRWFRQG